MRELTQSSVHPFGNCWQTAIACILDLDPEALPPQAKYDHKWLNEDGKLCYGPNYGVPLGLYLRKHHGLFYCEVQPSTFLDAVVPLGYHMLTGRTVRSDAQDGARHVVVAYRGRMIWDPHPTRAGLSEEIRLGVLIAFPPEYVDYWEKRSKEPCVCPACEPDKARQCECPSCVGTLPGP